MSIVKQVGGSHYGGVEFQHWDFVLQTGQDYLSAVATKYLCRWRQKNGISDVLKSISYVDKIIGGFARGELTWPLPINHEMAHLLWPKYLETYPLDRLEKNATWLLIFGANVHDLLEAKKILQRIVTMEVFSWPALSPIMSKMKPDGWQGFTFEGTKQDFCWHRCTTCREQFKAPIDQPPMLWHECANVAGVRVTVNNQLSDGEGKTVEAFPHGWHGLTEENGYKDA